MFLRKKTMVHCSMDDVLWIFKDITVHQEYTSIFDNSILKWIKDLHEIDNRMVFTLYCFFDAWYEFTLADATDRFQSEFRDNSKWLKVGFHGYGMDENNKDRTYEKPNDYELLQKDYQLVMRELGRVTSKESFTNIIRLSSFLGSEKAVTFLKKEGNDVFLCAEDKKRPSYYLSSTERDEMFSKGFYRDKSNKVYFVPTSIRCEKCDLTVGDIWNHYNPLIVFTHEWALLECDSEAKKTFEQIIKRLSEQRNVYYVG